MSGQEKKDWLCEQKVLNPEKWKAKKVTSTSVQADVKGEDTLCHDVNDAATEEMWIMEQMQMKKCQTFAEGQDLWKEVLKDDSFVKEWHVGSQQWLLKKFRGVRGQTGTRKAKENSLVSTRVIEDAEDFQEAEEQRAIYLIYRSCFRSI